MVSLELIFSKKRLYNNTLYNKQKKYKKKKKTYRRCTRYRKT